MSSESLHKIRKKSKLIFELRHKPILDLFDQRGLVVSKLSSRFKDKLPHWSISNVEIKLLNSNDVASKYIVIDHKSIRVMYEDIGSLQEFIDDTNNLFLLLTELPFYQNIKVVRIGERQVSVFVLNNYKTFEDITKRTSNIFYIQDSIGKRIIKDLQIVYEFENQHILIGPVGEKERWFKDVFFLPEINIPKCGLGIDVDSFYLNPTIHNLNEIGLIFSDLRNKTISEEKRILSIIEGKEFSD